MGKSQKIIKSLLDFSSSCQEFFNIKHFDYEKITQLVLNLIINNEIN